MNSARSRGSQSSRYRRVGSGREVDESLFGASPRTRNAGASIVSGATLNTLRDSNATFVSSGDLQRIMQSTWFAGLQKAPYSQVSSGPTACVGTIA